MSSTKSPQRRAVGREQQKIGVLPMTEEERRLLIKVVYRKLAELQRRVARALNRVSERGDVASDG